MSDLINMIKMHEGLVLTPYKCTANKTTIGYGRNLEDKGITEKEAEYLLQSDIEECKKNIVSKISFYEDLSEVRKAVLIDMCFNLGINGLMKFKNTLKAIQLKNYDLAANEMLNSNWAIQVKGRALRLSRMMRIGEWK